jgi:hypothetical protein
MWREESVEVKAKYKKLADEEKFKHQLEYPNYKCSPRKSAEIKKRKRSVKESMINVQEFPATKHPRLFEDILADPTSQPVTPQMEWQPFALFEGMAHETSQQPPDNLFFDMDMFEPIDWDREAAALDLFFPETSA